MIREELDLKKFKFNKANEFMAFPMALLEIACRYNIISENSRNEIFSRIMETAEYKAEEDLKVTSNFVYVLSMYLQENFTNWEVLVKLLNVNTFSDASNLIEEATDWLILEIAR